MADTVKVDTSRVIVALGRFRLSLKQNNTLMQQIADSQLLSVRRTFRDQGVPARSWVPLAPSTIRSNPQVYGHGHNLLIRSSRLLNSIQAETAPGRAVIGTSKVYARVHQFGSRDRSTAIGPQTETESKERITTRSFAYFHIQNDLGAGSLAHAGRRRILGPRNAKKVQVSTHTRYQNIPPRPYLVFRPEDPERIRGIVSRYVSKATTDAGLGGPK